MTAPDIISVDESNFEYRVIAYSQDIPVLVDFWAPWSEASRRISPLLENYARKAGGSFRLAKLNVEDNKTLARRYQINTIPTLAVFENGRVSHQLVGDKTNSLVNDFLRRVIPGPGNLLLEKARAKYQAGQYQESELVSRELLEEVPDHPGAYLLLTKSLIAQANIIAARMILEEFPASPEYSAAERLMPLVNALFSYRELGLESDFAGSAVYYRALTLVLRRNYGAALDGLLALLEEDKTHHEGQTRDIFLGILELLEEQDPETKDYRSRLANILF